jgi:hypothetical protein
MVRTVVVSAFYSSTDSNHETDSIWRLAVKNHRWYSEQNSYHYRFFEQPLAPTLDYYLMKASMRFFGSMQIHSLSARIA